MSAQELLDKIKDTSTVAYHKFMLLQRDSRNDLFCFFEGYDSGYYFPRVKEYFNGKNHSLICGNKENVINTYKQVKLNYNSVKTAFFIDSDFDESSQLLGVYETPCYSIENFYTSVETVSEILKNEFHLSEVDEEYKTAIAIYKSNQSDYHSKSILFNAWYATLRNTSKRLGQKTNVNLNCAIPKEFVVIHIGNIQGNYNLEDIYQKFPDALQINEQEVEEKVKEFQDGETEKLLRGKFELEFLYTFLQFLITDANVKVNNKILKVKTKFRVDKALMLSQLSQYAETPQCLIEYIKNFN